jgi:hypothetical protein
VFVMIVNPLRGASGSNTEAGFSEMFCAAVVPVVPVVVVMPTRVRFVRVVGAAATAGVGTMAVVIQNVI